MVEGDPQALPPRWGGTLACCGVKGWFHVLTPCASVAPCSSCFSGHRANGYDGVGTMRQMIDMVYREEQNLSLTEIFILTTAWN